ncbi:hypothetical protein QJS10_CPA05g00659 [Acorus calamus]|uniref:RRM domain-containing protein n=1 Tax=Acorus calamus TaxID=4465 RepID=A0AAV9EW06_ACOCL|nr:hypothetical protein QJS10_CPA05g00659 [Acorus calamus]
MAKKRKPLPEVDPEPPSEVEDEETSEDEEELPTMDSIRSLLEPFDKNQLIEILKTAALKDPSLLSRITDSAESEPGHRKIFVHGLGREVTSESLAEAFATYGEIENCNIVSDKATGRSKGYGFVTFATRRGAMKALKEPQKRIGGRTAMCQLASARPLRAGEGGGGGAPAGRPGADVRGRVDGPEREPNCGGGSGNRGGAAFVLCGVGGGVGD